MKSSESTQTRSLPMPLPIAALADDETFDVVVIGAGGAGMAAALFAAIDGAKVLLIESTDKVGGTTAYAGGTNWIPGNAHQAGVDPADTIGKAKGFLDRAVGDLSDPALRDSLLRHGADAIAKIEANSHVRYFALPLQPDYMTEVEGATMGGRALEPVPFDGRLLGEDFNLVRPPIPELTVLRGMMASATDVKHLIKCFESWGSFKHSTTLVVRHLLDRARGYSRGTRLVMGNALVARLLYSLRERNVAVMTETSVTRLSRSPTGVDGVRLTQHGQQRNVKVRGGVILASGGFNRHPGRRAERLPGLSMDWCIGAPGHTGSMHALAEEVGAHYGERGLTDFFWTPVSTRRRPDGSHAVFPHFSLDRCKPHMVAVDSTGKRFVNESTSWHLFALAMRGRDEAAAHVPAFLITDSVGMRKYGLGMVRPGGMGIVSALVDGMSLGRALSDGYVKRGNTLQELAGKLGIDGAELERTIADINTFSETGVDLQFGRGTTAYQRNFGDASWTGKNPNLGPIENGPFYGVTIYPGDIGAATGFKTDARARAVDRSGAAIPGLYVCGNDMHSAFGGVYAGPGITIGPGLVFGYLAADDAVARSRSTEPSGVARAVQEVAA